MRRSVIIGSVCTAYLILSASSSVAQELLHNDRDLVAGRLIFNNACRTCHTTSEGDNRLGPNQDYREESRFAAELWVFQCNEGCRLHLG